MLQFGCISACSTVTFSSSSFVPWRNGPPDAVRKRVSICDFFSPFKHWKIAECSLSTGRIDTPYSLASGIMICPAVTSVSLLARAISFPARIASMTGRSPIMPTIAATTTSTFGRVETATKPSIPYKISQE